MSTNEVVDLLKKYINLLNAEGISVYKAFLFGSYSYGKVIESSDIDVLIVSDNFNDTDDEAIGKMWKLTKKINSKIEPFLIGKSKFNQNSDSPLIYDIKTNGIEIL